MTNLSYSFRGEKTANLHDISKACGVSIGTVSRILRGEGKNVRSDARERARLIRETAHKMGYRPHTWARALATGSSRLIGLLRSHKSSVGGISGLGLHVIEEEIHQLDRYLLTAHISEKAPMTQETVLQFIQNLGVDGLIILYGWELPEPVTSLLQQYPIPSIWLNVKLNKNSLHPNDFEGTALGVSYLYERGHRNIVYLGNYASCNCHYSVQDRADGYRHAMQNYGLATTQVGLNPEQSCLDRATSKYQGIFSLLSSANRPSSVICYSSHEARMVVMAATQLNIRIPQQLSIVNISESINKDMGIHLTTACIPTVDMCRQAITMLMTRIAQPSQSLPSRAIRFNMLEAQSTAPFDPSA